MASYKFFFAVTVLIFAAVFVSLFYIKDTTGNFLKTDDYYFHYYKAQGKCYLARYTQENCDRYAPLFSIIAAPFAWNEVSYILFCLALLTIVIPFLIFQKTKSLWSLLIYFSGSFAMHTLFASIYAQAILTILFVMMVRTDKLMGHDFIYFALGYFAHSTGLYVLGAVLVWKALSEYIPVAIAPFCVAWDMQGNTFFDYSVIYSIMPIVNYFYMLSLKLLKKLLILFFIVGSILVECRALLFLPILCALWLPEIIEKKPTKIKAFYALNCLAWSAFQLIFWLSGIYSFNTTITII